jgi:1-acyl-sn-glycerol-3-phosphate acyltransferase
VVILGAVRLIVFVLDTAIWMPVIGLVSLCEREGHTAFRVGQWWAWVNLKLVGAHLTVEGLEHLDPNRSYVFVSNHRSNLDVLALVGALWDFQLRWVAKEELFRIPLFGWALRATKQILVNRADHAQALASLAEAKQRMHDGVSVVFFPEGTRDDGPMLPFKKGGFVFAIETGVPVVPIGITGTERLMPRTAWTVHQGGDIRVHICAPIPTTGLSREDRNALLAEARQVIATCLEGREGRHTQGDGRDAVPATGVRSPVRS